MNYITKGVGIASNIFTDNVSGMVSGSLGVLGNYAKEIDLKNRGAVMNGVPQGNEILYSGGAGIFVSQEVYKAEYIHLIDDYFTHYGYQINETKTPSLHNRKNFDYIKTQDINIVGRIPQEDMNELKSLFNNGLTIWHNPATFGDFDVDNSPIA